MRSQYREWKVDMGSTPNQQAIYNWYMLARKIQSHWIYLAHFLVVPMPSWLTQNEVNDVFVEFLFRFAFFFPWGEEHSLSVLILVLMFLWVVCFLFLFMYNFTFRKKKHKVGWVRKWGGSGRSWERRKTWS